MIVKDFEPIDVKKILNIHQSILNGTIKIIKQNDAAKFDSKKAAEAYVAAEVSKILDTVSVEELSRYKSGIRVKSLLNNNVNTFADLEKISTRALIDINGISQETALTIKKILAFVKNKITQETKIRLSADNKTEYSTALIKNVYLYKYNLNAVKDCRKFYSKYYNQIRILAESTLPMTNNFKWFFTSKSQKSAAIDAYNKLKCALETEPFLKIQEIIENNKQTSFSANDIWEDFEKNSIEYFTILEEIVPGLIGSNDTFQGLPEELAEEVKGQSLDLLGLKCTLRKYQEWGVKYILHQKRVLLGDEMGLGKTIQAIATMVAMRNGGEKHFLVVCPASVLTNWCREIQKHSDLEAIKIHGKDKKENLELWLNKGGVAVTTYETTSIFELEDQFKVSLTVVDEAHYIKNPEAKRTENTKKICNKSKSLLFMTGTALENQVEEMISLIYILQPEIAHSVKNITVIASAPKFKEKIAPVYYRRKRTDVLTELPELIESEEWCELSFEEEQIYENSVIEQQYAECRRVSFNIDDLSKSTKANRLLEIIEEAEEEGRKVIVFSFFLDTIQKIALMLGSKCYGPITGAVPPNRRQEIIDEFEKAPSGSVLVAQIQSGGTGLNIQCASVVVICEPQFKPSTENQAISRAYRMGQARNVLVHRLLCEDTIDEKLTKVLKHKQDIFDAFADESVSAQKSMEIDDDTFSNLMKEETERINQKRGITANDNQKTPE